MELAQYSKDEGTMQATDLGLDWDMYMEVDGSLEQEEALLLVGQLIKLGY